MSDAATAADPLRRVEDPRLLTGRGHYIANLRVPGMAHLAVLRSPHAAARIVHLDTSGAREVPGVLEAAAGAELADELPAMPVTKMVPGLATPTRRPLATDRVSYVGEPVAYVVATSEAIAHDALERIVVDYEPTPAVIAPEEAAEDGAPLVHPDLGSNIAYRLAVGEPGGAFEAAAVTVRQRMVNQRLIPSAMETRGVVADHRALEGTCTLHLTTQAPHIVRSQLARVLGLAENALRVVAGDVGGAFGGKFNVFPEEVLAALASRRLARPVRWIETRSEAATASTHGRGQVADVSVAATADGRITALHARILSDLGAHFGVVPPTGAYLSAQMLSGPYAIGQISFEVAGVFTNTAPIDPYRGYYRAEATYYLERIVDLLGDELGLDPVDVRRRNLIGPGQLPYTTATGEVYDTGDYPALLEEAVALAGYDDLRGEQRRRDPSDPLMGIGVSTYVWRASFPSAPFAPPGIEFLPGGWDTASVRVERGGGVTVRTAASPHGQGLANALARVVAEVLGVAPGDVAVRAGDTDTAPYGMGSAGSRSMVVAGSAVREAAWRVREQAEALAAHLLEAPVEDLEWQGRQVQVRGVPARAIDLYELGRQAAHATRPTGMDPCLEGHASFDPDQFTYPAGCHICVVEVDPATGAVRVVRHVAVDDCGRVMVPEIVEGQVHGATVQGIAQALLEEAYYDAAGQLATTSLADYLIPSAAEVPFLETARRPSPTPRNPLGVKGAGEAGAIGAPPAVVNAVIDALAPLGIRHLDMPVSPERVFQATRAVGPAPG